MKSFTKRTGAIIAAAALATSLATAGVLLLNNGDVALAATENEGRTYFYDKLGNDESAKRFYDAFSALANDGTLKNGSLEYDLVANSVASTTDVASYVNCTNRRVVEAYSAGRDSFIMDNPDLFYVDLFGTSISAGTIGGNYVAYLDSSRVDNLYRGELNTVEKVNQAIEKYESELKIVVDGAKQLDDVVEQIKYVNNYICDKTTYSYGTELKDGKYVDTAAAAYIYTSYGALVYGEAVCEGYSNAFKAVMDRLDIPCVSIHGYHLYANGTSVPHSWNAVKVEGNWYYIDVTFNDTGSNREEYMLQGYGEFNRTHQTDNVISTSGFELDYPAISPYDYGVNNDANGMNITSSYEEGTATDGTAFKIMCLNVSFDNKGGEKLHEEGKYFAYRYGTMVAGEIQWGLWISAVEGNEVAPAWMFEDTKSTTLLYPGIQYIQVAVINRAPDFNDGATYPPESGIPYNYKYLEENLKDSDFEIAPSAVFENEGYGSYVPAPFGYANPSNSGELPVNATYEITITYNESLELIDTNKGAGMEFICARNNATAQTNAKLENVKWNGNNVVSFTFTPSQMYEHIFAGYNFVPVNLRGVSSKKVPSPVTYYFQAKQVICSRVFNDGRQYMLVYGQPEILDTSDISVTDFQDENGHYYAESQRSQLVLVANKPTADTQEVLDNMLLDETALKKEDILASTSYEIDLQICGCITKVPNGSYMQVSIGFPEGYGPDDAGVTFQIYHYKHDDAGNIIGVEEIPAIITQYGLIARVTSFSPFTIVAVKSSSEAVTESQKAVYASVSGNGSLTTAGGSGISFVEGDSITYNVTAKEGYQVSYILLNGNRIDEERYADGTLTLSAEELEQGNILEAIFVTEQSAQSYAEKGVTIAAIGISTTIVPDSGVNVGAIIGCIMILLIVIAAVVLTIVLVRRYKIKA